jgi:hypothetical protein
MRDSDIECGHPRTLFPLDRGTFLKQKTQLRFRRWVPFEQLTVSFLAH